ncbi:lipocalin family protein [Spongiivirga citrea]|uniref:Lipocalin-like domain-containing protein n=1 Tax=Spongiivirga citrea TaxID=1481457 RepID=A0A6M0CI27_9FLAO|nr:lipocalin family protein [Spongiivirga citrea]NER17618.1 hypothetical protein [Spongiivirga citrea]
MKKIGLFLVVISFLSCSKGKDSTIDPNLIGLWEISSELGINDIPSVQNEGYERVTQFNFNMDGSFEFGSFIRNINSRSILAYSQRYLGTYEIEGDRLNLTYDYWGAQPLDDQYGDLQSLDELILVNENQLWSFTYSISDNQKIVFDYDPCGPAENCIDSSTLYRVD